MAKKSKEKKQTLVGGKNAEKVNPHGLVKKFKAICITENKVLSPRWRDTRAEARQDAREHIEKGHFIDYDIKISG